LIFRNFADFFKDVYVAEVGIKTILKTSCRVTRLQIFFAGRLYVGCGRPCAISPNFLDFGASFYLQELAKLRRYTSCFVVVVAVAVAVAVVAVFACLLVIYSIEFENLPLQQGMQFGTLPRQQGNSARVHAVMIIIQCVV
jgi:hypothetical protein